MSAIKKGYLYDPVAKKQRKAMDEEDIRQEMILQWNFLALMSKRSRLT